MIRSIVLLWVALTLLVSGCDDASDNYLKGSLVDTYKISFDETRIRLYDTGLAIEYVGEQKQTTLRVTLNVSPNAVARDVKYDLKQDGTINRDSGLGSALPELESGELTLTAFSAENGSDVEGTFEAVFTTIEKTKQTLRGGFVAKLEVVDFQ